MSSLVTMPVRLDALIAAVSIGSALYLLRLALRKPPPPPPPPLPPDVLAAKMGEVEHDLRRQQLIASGKPVDNAGHVTAKVMRDFDLNKTIFKTLANPVLRLAQRSNLDAEFDFDAATADAVTAAYATVPRPGPEEAAIFKFMATECDFSMEHADGSFMDHLHFCREYSLLHYPQAPARVLLLHSICGVGTNCFPMAAEKLPMLKSLLSEHEFRQIQAFPSILRLLVHGTLLDEIAGKNMHRVDQLESLHFHRMLDNEPISLTADEFWEQMNFQLIHLLDFLPVGGWQGHSSFFLHYFAAIYAFLKATGKLVAKVRFSEDWALPPLPGTRPDTIRHRLLDTIMTKDLVLKLIRKAVTKYSADISHELDLQVKFSPAAAAA